MTPHIGMKLWRWNENRRVYERNPETGRAMGGPIWREHWEPCEIIGETSRSWLVGQDYMKTWSDISRKAEKIPKSQFPGEYATSEEDIERRAYVIGMRHKLADKIRVCKCYETIKKIEDALGVNS